MYKRQVLFQTLHKNNQAAYAYFEFESSFLYRAHHITYKFAIMEQHLKPFVYCHTLRSLQSFSLRFLCTVASFMLSILVCRGLPLFLPSGDFHFSYYFGYLSLHIRHTCPNHLNLVASVVSYKLVHVFITSLIS